MKKIFSKIILISLMTLILLAGILLVVFSYYSIISRVVFDSVDPGFLARIRFLGIILVITGAILGSYYKFLIPRLENSFHYSSGCTERFYVYLLSLVIASGSAIRIIFLQYPIRSYEALNYLEYINRSVTDIISRPSTYNHHLNSIIVHVFDVLFGNDVWVLRVPSLVFGILLIPVSFILGRELHNKKTGMISACLTAVSPAFIYLSVNSLGYSLGALVTTGLFIVMNRLIEEYRYYRMVIAIILTALLMFISPVMAYPIIIIIIWVLLAFLNNRKLGKFKPAFKRGLIYLAGSSILTFFFYLPSIKNIGFAGVLKRNFLISSPYNIIDSIMTFLSESGTDLPFIVFLLAGTVLSFVFWKQAGKKYLVLFIFLLVFTIPLILLLRNTVQLFLIYAVFPILITIASSGIASLLKLIVKGCKKSIFAISASAILILTLFSLNIFINKSFLSHGSTYVLKDAESITSYIKDNIEEGDKIIAGSSGRHILEYYFNKDNVTTDYFLGYLKPENKLYIIVNKTLGEDTYGILLEQNKDYLRNLQPGSAAVSRDYGSATVYVLKNMDFENKVILDFDSFNEARLTYVDLSVEDREIIIDGEQGTNISKGFLVPVGIKSHQRYLVTFEIKEVKDISRELHFYFFGQGYNDSAKYEEIDDKVIGTNRIMEDYNQFEWIKKTGELTEGTDYYFRLTTKTDGVISIKNILIYELD